MSEAIAVLLAVLFGGITPFVANRREVTRTHRVDLHLDLLPQLRYTLEPYMQDKIEPFLYELWHHVVGKIEAIERVALIGGRRDARRARWLLDAARRIGPWDHGQESEYGNETGHPSGQGRTRGSDSCGHRGARAFESWIRRKLRSF